MPVHASFARLRQDLTQAAVSRGILVKPGEAAQPSTTPGDWNVSTIMIIVEAPGPRQNP